MKKKAPKDAIGLTNQLFQNYVGGQCHTINGKENLVGDIKMIEFEPTTRVLKITFLWRALFIDQQWVSYGKFHLEEELGHCEIGPEDHLVFFQGRSVIELAERGNKYNLSPDRLKKRKRSADNLKKESRELIGR
ncbi:MAG TPA: hypothetical protein VLE47_02310 [Candidatus Saccharimonadales bacterium]|nr:hypothetical protein [Candidatus Saccharimonadales bacterium]